MMTVSTLCRPEVSRDLNTGERMFRQEREGEDDADVDIFDGVDIDAAALEQMWESDEVMWDVERCEEDLNWLLSSKQWWCERFVFEGSFVYTVSLVVDIGDWLVLFLHSILNAVIICEVT